MIEAGPEARRATGHGLQATGRRESRGNASAFFWESRLGDRKKDAVLVGRNSFRPDAACRAKTRPTGAGSIRGSPPAGSLRSRRSYTFPLSFAHHPNAHVRMKSRM